MAAPQIIMYTKSWCPYCERARALLKAKGVAYREINIESQPELCAEMMRRTGRRTVPQIFIGDRHVGGSDDIYELDAAGGLDPLLHS
jgi:glutaredoxin 3